MLKVKFDDRDTPPVSNAGVFPDVPFEKVMAPVYVTVRVFPAENVLVFQSRERQVNPAVPASVIFPSKLSILKKTHVAPVPIVTVKSLVPEFELLSKNTLSAVVGADAPEAPPLVADQLAVLVEFHVPEPPTQ